MKLPKSICSLALVLSLISPMAMIEPASAQSQSQIQNVLQQAAGFEAQGQYQEAGTLLTNSINYNPKNPAFWSLYLTRGFIWFQLGNIVNAGNDFEAAGTLNPNEGLCYMARGMAFAALGNFDKALLDMNVAINKKPNEAKFWFQRAYVYSLMNNYPQALADLEKSASLRTTQYERSYDHAARAVVYGRNNEFDKVEPEVSAALNIFNSCTAAQKAESAPALSECALARALKGDEAGCKQLIDLGNSITPISNLTRSRLLAITALWNGMQGKVAEANMIGQQAIALAPQYKWVTAISTTAVQVAQQKSGGGTVVAQQPYVSPASVATTTTTTQTPNKTTTVVTQGPKAADKPIDDKWALVVGISKFQDGSIGRLKYSAKDAKDFAEFLVAKCNFKRDHVRLLLDEQATQRRILEELGDKFLPRVADPNDLVVFYFSSHGSPAKADSSQVEKGYRPKNYLIAYDTSKTSLFASGINVNDLTQLMKERVPTDRILIVLDACHSGAADANAKDGDDPRNIDPEQVAGTGQMVICSSKSDERSWESKRYANGVFTKHLMDALVEKRKIKDAFTHMEDTVAREVKEDEAARQTPVMKDQWSGADVSLLAQPFKPRPFPPSVKEKLAPDSMTLSPAASSRPK
ncbi:MAG: caspase family protein [Candidatus Melainabacteria bacterium]|nr:caspase family protein [Candidatus Melainabacteria bacterium]